MKQSDLFLQSEGDAWHARNRDKPRLPDPVIEAMKELKLAPKTMLELGCGNGWRLAEIQKIFRPTVLSGYDASMAAIKDRQIETVYQSDVLEALKHIRDGFYDIIIFGFCLYLLDREDLMMIAAHTDRVLKDGGHIIIHDFVDGPHKVAYKHKEGVWSYHMDHSELWCAHRGYYPIYGPHKNAQSIGVMVLKKNFANAFPERAI